MSEFSTIMRLLERASADIKEIKDRLGHPSILFANQDAIGAGATQEIMDALDEVEKVNTRSGRKISPHTQKVAAQAYVKASDITGDEVPDHIRELADDSSTDAREVDGWDAQGWKTQYEMARTSLKGVEDDLTQVTSERDEAQMERSDLSIERDNLLEHIETVYDMLDERYCASRHGSKAEKAIGEIMTFMETNPVKTVQR